MCGVGWTIVVMMIMNSVYALETCGGSPHGARVQSRGSLTEVVYQDGLGLADEKIEEEVCPKTMSKTLMLWWGLFRSDAYGSRDGRSVMMIFSSIFNAAHLLNAPSIPAYLTSTPSDLKRHPIPLNYRLPTARKPRPLTSNLHKPRPHPLLLLLLFPILLFRLRLWRTAQIRITNITMHALRLWSLVVRIPMMSMLGSQKLVHARLAKDVSAGYRDDSF